MAKQASYRASDVNRPPADQPFIWHQRELLVSPAWRGRSINCIRLIDYLLVEHMNHAGTENGNLVATHRQLEQWGIGHRHVVFAIDEAIARGLITVRRGGKKGLVENHLSRFKLTFYTTREAPVGLAPYWIGPSNDWKALSEDQIQERIAKRRHVRERNRSAARKTENRVPKVSLYEVPKVTCSRFRK